jgi:flagellar export protein FliJ
MAKFKFRLATYLRLREAVRDERRSHLAQAYRAEALILREQGRLDAESAAAAAKIRDAAGPGQINADRLLDAQRYQVVLRAQSQHLAEQHEQVNAEIQRRHHALVEANRDCQVLEKLRARQQEQHRYQENRREIGHLDEIGQRRTVGQASSLSLEDRQDACPTDLDTEDAR